MTFLDPRDIQAACGGRWLVPPSGAAALRGVGIDTREDLAGRAFIALRGDRHDGHAFLAQASAAGAGLLVVERDLVPGVDPKDAAVLQVDSTRAALADLARAWRRQLTTTRVIAVTGSAGKTTTKSLIHAVLSRTLAGSAAPRSFNNDIGVPLTILAADPGDAYLVIEIGTNAPGEVARLASIAAPDIAVITTVGRAHLEGLGTIESVVREKMSLVTALTPDGVAVVNADVPALRSWCAGRTTVLVGAAADADVRLTGRGRHARGQWIEVNGSDRFELGLPGRHNAQNALVAIAVARRLGAPEASVRSALAEIEAAPMRMSVHEIGDLLVYNDAYNANPESVIAALDAFLELASERSRRVVVLGDMLELGADAAALHAEVGRAIAARAETVPIERIVLVGPRAAFMADGLGSAWRERVTRLERLPSDAASFASLFRAGDAVLLKGSRGMAMERVIDLLERGRGTREWAGASAVAAG